MPKLADDITMFLLGKIWQAIKHRMSLYTEQLDKPLRSAVRRHDIKAAAYIAAKIEGVEEMVKIIERLNHEIKNNQFDANVDLGVIENKPS